MRIDAEACPVAVAAESLIADRPLDDEHERIQQAVLGVVPGLHEVATGLEGEHRVVQYNARAVRDHPAEQILQARRRGRRHRHRLAITAQPGRRPQDVNLTRPFTHRVLLLIGGHSMWLPLTHGRTPDGPSAFLNGSVIPIRAGSLATATRWNLSPLSSSLHRALVFRPALGRPAGGYRPPVAIKHPVERGDDGRSMFDRLAESTSNLMSTAAFFAICGALVVVWTLSYALDWSDAVRFFLGDLLGAITLVLVALIKNAERRAEHAVQVKLDAISRMLLASHRGDKDGAADDLERAIGHHEDV